MNYYKQHNFHRYVDPIPLFFSSKEAVVVTPVWEDSEVLDEGQQIRTIQTKQKSCALGIKLSGE